MDLRLIIVDDDRDFLEIMGKRIRELGFSNILLQDDPVQAAARIESGRPFDLALIDMTMPGMNGLELLDQIKAVSPATECIMITAVNEARTAVECLRKGAYDYLIKPVAQEDLALSVHRALEHRRLIHILDIEKGKTPLTLKNRYAFKGIDTRSACMQRIMKEAELHAGSDVPVLITGESGTGKEVLAQAIHKASPRSTHAFTAINMASLNGSLFDAEFFGHTRGAFTGADKARSGYLEKTHLGTLFLDEIGHLPLAVQGKLLRFMQDGSYYRVGASTHRQADIRFVAATNADLDKLMAKGLFRKDLYYRIRGGWLHLPPLRERKEDIPLLVSAFMKAEKPLKRKNDISNEALNCLMRFDFPGNVRELKSIIQSALNLAQGRPILPDHLPRHLLEKKNTVRPDCLMEGLPTSTLADVEREHIICTYQQAGHNKSKTARVLGIGLNTLRRKLSAYGVA
jgi:two-component system response regulator AtoC